MCHGSPHVWEIETSLWIGSQYQQFGQQVVLCTPSLKYLDLRFNEFEGTVPRKLFDLQIYALFHEQFF